MPVVPHCSLSGQQLVLNYLRAIDSSKYFCVGIIKDFFFFWSAQETQRVLRLLAYVAKESGMLSGKVRLSSEGL